jgi:myosin-15
MLENYGISPENATNGHHKITLKRNVVEMAKEWPLYFARLYPVSVSVLYPYFLFTSIARI